MAQHRSHSENRPRRTIETVEQFSHTRDEGASDIREGGGARLNVEIKARATDHRFVRRILEERMARRVGEDRQTDTYFNVPEGRLKLREGNIENTLIFYRRTNMAGPKKSEVLLYRVDPDPDLKEVLTASLGVKVVVAKRREIWFDGNVKIHLDDVDGLGLFLEIEAIDSDGSRDEAELTMQCRHFMDLFEISEQDLIEISYSDLLDR